MNKNHLDVLLVESSHLVSKYKRLSIWSTGADADFYLRVSDHYLKIYRRVMLKRFPPDL